MTARDENRRDYILGCLRDAGAMHEQDARAFLAEHDAAVRIEVLREADEVALHAALGCADSEAGRYAVSVAAGIAAELRRMADTAALDAHRGQVEDAIRRNEPPTARLDDVIPDGAA